MNCADSWPSSTTDLVALWSHHDVDATIAVIAASATVPPSLAAPLRRASLGAGAGRWDGLAWCPDIADKHAALAVTTATAEYVVQHVHVDAVAVAS